MLGAAADGPFSPRAAPHACVRSKALPAGQEWRPYKGSNACSLLAFGAAAHAGPADPCACCLLSTLPTLQAKTKELKSSFNDQFSAVHELCLMVLNASQRPDLIRATLSTLYAFLSWVPLGYIFESNVIEVGTRGSSRGRWPPGRRQRLEQPRACGLC